MIESTSTFKTGTTASSSPTTDDDTVAQAKAFSQAAFSEAMKCRESLKKKKKKKENKKGPTLVNKRHRRPPMMAHHQIGLSVDTKPITDDHVIDDASTVAETPTTPTGTYRASNGTTYNVPNLC